MDRKKKLIIEIILFIVVLIGITIVYNYVINSNVQQSRVENILNNDEAEEKIEIMEIQNAEQFEQEVIKEEGLVFIDFYATWCMPCKTMNPIIKEIAKEHKEVKFVKVDVDKNEKLAIQYNVMNIPTMIIMKNGEIAKSFVGIVNKQTIVNELYLENQF